MLTQVSWVHRNYSLMWLIAWCEVCSPRNFGNDWASGPCCSISHNEKSTNLIKWLIKKTFPLAADICIVRSVGIKHYISYCIQLLYTVQWDFATSPGWLVCILRSIGAADSSRWAKSLGTVPGRSKPSSEVPPRLGRLRNEHYKIFAKHKILTKLFWISWATIAFRISSVNLATV